MADGAKFGTAGVMLVDQEYTATDGSVESAQNADLVFDAEEGGEPSLQKRGGIVPLGTAFASGVVAVIELKFVASL